MVSLTKRQVVILLGVILLGLGGWMLWKHYHQPQPVTGESQQQAETAAGVELAAKNAHIELLQSQLDEAAKQIAKLQNQPPDTVIKTVPVEVEKVVVKEVEKRGADFAIVTDPKQPDKQVDLKEVEKLPESTTVNLNQYNVFAYKKAIKGFNVYPDWSESIKKGSPRLQEVSYDVSRRITKDGKYFGGSIGYDFKHDEAKVGLRYSF